MDKSLFYTTALAVMDGERAAGGIGTLGEKTLHAILKRYFEPDVSKHEIKVGRYVADIRNDAGITEIQTRQFGVMRKKLEYFLQENTVTVVYPVAQVKWLTWMNTKTGETAEKRRSPKAGRPQEIFAELYRIRPLLLSDNLHFCIVMLEMQELRHFDGMSRGRRKNPERCDRYPSELCGEIEINGPGDYRQLIPAGLPQPFTSRDFGAACGIPRSLAQTALNVLSFTGTVRRTGKKGNAFLYTTSPF
ncbi:MAG: hypothetical protein P4L75_03115 [Clostridia bacterium]|nr:hypothetical protein [Clostridia bacterium]